MQFEINSSTRENYPSLECTSGYHFDTPPTVSLESEIQPCGIDEDRTTVTTSSGPSSLDIKSTGVASEKSFSETSNSSEYRALTEVSSMSSETHTKNVVVSKEIIHVDSSTEDQMSSGTFSIDDNSPRYAELPAKLKTILPPEESDAEEEPVKLGRKMSEKLFTLDTRSTSIASDVSDQEIPPTTPRSDPSSPSFETGKFPYLDKVEKFSHETVNIMTQSIYVSSDEKEGEESSYLNETMGNIMGSFIEATDDVLQATLFTKQTELVAQSISENTSILRDVKLDIKEEKVNKGGEITGEKSIKSNQKEQQTKTEPENPKPVKEEEQPSSSLTPAAKSLDGKASTGKDDEKVDPIAGWGKPLALPSPVRPGTPAKHSKKADDESVDSNKVV